MGEQSESTYGRRDIIKKTAVAGAVAWTAPVIVSSRALATDGSPGPCANYYVVKIDGSPTGGTLHCGFPAGYRQLIDPGVIAGVITGSHTDPIGGSFTLASNVKLVQVVGKKRSDECNVAGGTALTPFNVISLGGGAYSVPNSNQSHIMVVFCSDDDLGGVNTPAGSTPLGPIESAATSEAITGTGETSTGTGETSTGTGETSTGTGETSTGTGETSTGTGETSTGTGETSTGTGETSTGTGETSTGTGETSTGTGETSTGTGETSTGTGETSTGTGETSTGTGETSTGTGETSTGTGETSTGTGETSTGTGETSTGTGETSTGG